MFTPHKNDGGHVLPWEYLPAAAGTYKAGQLLTISGGKLAAISKAHTTSPEYLCCADIVAAADDNVPVVRVKQDTIFATTLSAAASGAVIGSKLEVSAGGLEADNAAAGTFELVALDGNAKGDTVYGRFA